MMDEENRLDKLKRWVSESGDIFPHPPDEEALHDGESPEFDEEHVHWVDFLFNLIRPEEHVLVIRTMAKLKRENDKMRAEIATVPHIGHLREGGVGENPLVVDEYDPCCPACWLGKKFPT